ncbi:MAG: EamA family transporter [Alphaproteobacteria bacterium]|nr:EamA family transporter [Alphaproteobacteria bacterium]
MLLIADGATQVALKLGSGALGDMAFGWRWLETAVANPWTWVAAASYFTAFIAWMAILKSQPLSVAFPMSAVAYPMVVMASWLILGESVGFLRWVGILCIVGGVWLMAETSSEQQVPPEQYD